MIDREQVPAELEGDYVAFLETGDIAKGSYRCSGCGYGVVVAGGLPVCPMCGSTTWEESAWSPFGRSGQL